MNELYFGITGRMASGKGEVVKILSKIGFKYISLSDIVRNEASKMGREINREDMQNLGNNLRKTGGSGILAKQVKKKIMNSNSRKWVIDGIRNPAEVNELRNLKPFYLIGIDCEFETIIDRIIKRKRNTDRSTKQDIIIRLNREWGQGEAKDGQQVGKCLKMADFIIQNNESLKILETNINKIISCIREKNV